MDSLLLKYIVFFSVLSVSFQTVAWGNNAVSSPGLDLLTSTIENNPFRAQQNVFAQTEYAWGQYGVEGHSPDVNPTTCPTQTEPNRRTFPYNADPMPDRSGEMSDFKDPFTSPRSLYLSNIPTAMVGASGGINIQNGLWNITEWVDFADWTPGGGASPITFSVIIRVETELCVFDRTVGSMSVTIARPDGFVGPTLFLAFFSISGSGVFVDKYHWLTVILSVNSTTAQSIGLRTGRMNGREDDYPHRAVVDNQGVVAVDSQAFFPDSFFSDKLYQTHFTSPPPGCGDDTWCKLASIGSGIVFLLATFFWVILLIFSFVAALFLLGVVIGLPTWLTLLLLLMSIPYWATLVTMLAGFIRGTKL